MILPGVAKVGYYRRDLPGRGTAQGIEHNQQFHQGIIDRLASRLNDIDVGSSNAFFNLDMKLGIGKSLHFNFSQINVQVLGDLLS